MLTFKQTKDRILTPNSVDEVSAEFYPHCVTVAMLFLFNNDIRLHIKPTLIYLFLL